jgi:hypothetical protein
MSTAWLGVRPLFIDQEGTLAAEPPSVAAARNRFTDRQQLAEYAVKNLDLVRVWCAGRGLRVQFRPERLRAKALARLLYLLSDCGDVRVGLDYFRDGWHHELVGHGDAARQRIVALVEESASFGVAGAVLAKAVDLDELRGRNPLHDLVQSWHGRLDWRQFGLLLERTRDCTGGRFVLFEHDRDRAAFLFRDFGAGLPHWAKDSLARSNGRALGDLHPDPFGKATTVAYRQALESLSPSAAAMDANIRWPGHGMLRSRYWRLLLPVMDPAGRFWLLSASLADTGIDLRKAG